jgi:hypothetical protein
VGEYQGVSGGNTDERFVKLSIVWLLFYMLLFCNSSRAKLKATDGVACFVSYLPKIHPRSGFLAKCVSKFKGTIIAVK